MGYCKRCGTLIDESSEFCPQCGAPQQEDGQAAQTNQSSQNVQHNHECCCTEQSGKEKLLNIPKKAWRIIIPVAVLLLLCFTNPSKTKHVEAIHTELMKVLEQQGDSEATVYASLGAGIIDKVLVSKLDVSNYFIFSIGSLQDGTKSKMVSFGILGHVFTSGLDKEALGDMKKTNKTLGL